MLYFMYHKYLGRTPLSRAADYGHTNIVKILLSHGANPNVQTKAGMHNYFGFYSLL